MDIEKLNEVENILGYKFKNIELLQTALTHSSYANDYLGDSHLGNERLEFLGDAILDLVIGAVIYYRFPDKQEGFMSKLRAEMVCEESLAKVAIDNKLNDYLLLGKGEDLKGGHERHSIIADMMEAIVAAVFVDAGLETGQQIVYKLMGPIIEDGCQGKLPGDTKTQLQEYYQKRGSEMPYYKLIEEKGPDHDKTFVMGVYYNGEEVGVGSGKNKKTAEANAARLALERIKHNNAKK